MLKAKHQINLKKIHQEQNILKFKKNLHWFIYVKKSQQHNFSKKLQFSAKSAQILPIRKHMVLSISRFASRIAYKFTLKDTVWKLKKEVAGGRAEQYKNKKCV